jgi:F-type H+-transporting ATPase subunit a
MSSFAPEVIFYLGKFPVTNTVLNTLLVDAFLLGLAYFGTRSLKLIPTPFQNIVEFLVGSLYDFTKSISEKMADKIFPYFMTFFLFILVANFSNLIPGINTFGIKEHGEIIPLFRGTTSDLNTTLALAIIAVVATHLLGIRTLGLTAHVSRFLPFIPSVIGIFKGKAPKLHLPDKSPITIVLAILVPLVLIFVGFLELVSQLVNVISLSFRLFGNIYAGEVVMKTVSGIFAVFVPIPFYMLEIIVGFVQALVFSMLTLVFMIILSTPHSEESHA